jgi:arylsulfatase A-like enzyme
MTAPRRSPIAVGPKQDAIAGLTALCVVAMMTVGMGCERSSPGPRLARVSDIAYADRLGGDGATARFPHVELAGDTRVTCSAMGGRPAPSGSHFSGELVLRSGDRIELAYGLDAAEAQGEVEFIVTLIGADDARVTFRAVLDGLEGRESGRWHDATIDPSSIVGRARIELATASSTLAGSGGDPSAAARPYFSCPIIVNSRTDRGTKPNVILISLDTLRADRLGIYGYSRGTSPNIDDLSARGGIVVERTYSQATNTLRGHAAMLTGLNPAISVAVGTGKHRSGKSTRGMPTLADHLRRAGYRTTAFTEGGYVSAAYGFAQGFDVFVESKTPYVASGEVAETFAKAAAWARSHAADPMFLFVHTYEVHNPYEPPSGYRERFAVAAGATAVEIDSALYDAEIAYTDVELAKLLDALREAGVLENAVVIVTADHGEEFGEHGGRYHGAHLHDEVLRVPLLILAPAILPAGVRRSGPAGLVDLLPSVLELTGLPVPEYLSGISLVDHLRNGAPLADRSIASEAFTPLAHTVSGLDDTWQSPALAITRFPIRVVRLTTSSGPRYEAYDLARDPAERTNAYDGLRATRPAVGEMVAALAAYEADSGAFASELAVRLGLPAEPSQAANAPSEANRERLRALGYVE